MYREGRIMKTLGRFVLLIVFVIAVTLIFVGSAQIPTPTPTVTPTVTPEPQDKESCHNINAKGIGQDIGNGTTQANIIGGGLLHGETEGNFGITSIVGSVASFEGTVKFITKHGNLIVTVIGTLDVVTGEFSASGPVTYATGKLTGTSGEINLKGVEDLSTGKFIEDVTGRICVDLSP